MTRKPTRRVRSALAATMALGLIAAACGDDDDIAGSAAVTSAADTADPNHFEPDPISGYESRRWHDLTNRSPKYVFGRALVDLEPTAENLKRVAEANGLEYLGGDLVRFPDGTIVDSIYDFGGPKAVWQYQVSH